MAEEDTTTPAPTVQGPSGSIPIQVQEKTTTFEFIALPPKRLSDDLWELGFITPDGKMRTYVMSDQEKRDYAGKLAGGVLIPSALEVAK